MNAPKLRFNEFNKEWVEIKLGSVCSFSKGKDLSKADLNETGEPCILYGELYTKYGPVINEVHSRTEKNSDSLIKAKKYDVLIPSSGETAIDIACASSLNLDNVLIGGDLNILTPSTEVNGHFLSYQINGKRKYKLSTLAQGATVTHLYADSIKKLNCYFPSSEEQKRITSFLQLIDKKIQLQQEKVNLLNEQKRGYIQKIFSQELRFKDIDGKAFPQWKSIRLNNFASKITNKNKDLAIKNVISNSAKNGLISQKEFFDKEIANQENIDGYYVISNGDFVYNPRISNDAPYGPINIYKGTEDGIVSPLYMCFSVKEINKEYLYHYFKGSLWFKYIYMNGDSGARHDRVSIKDSIFLEMPILVPSIAEQNLIADFISTLQKKIDIEEKRIKGLLNQKHAFMQQMFI